MDNMAIQIVGTSKEDVTVCVQKIFNNLSLPQQEINIVEKSQASLDEKDAKSLFTLGSNLYFVGIDCIDLTALKDISKEQKCQIYVNFEYKTFLDDVVFNNGQASFGLLLEEYQMFSA